MKNENEMITNSNKLTSGGTPQTVVLGHTGKRQTC